MVGDKAFEVSGCGVAGAGDHGGADVAPEVLDTAYPGDLGHKLQEEVMHPRFRG